MMEQMKVKKNFIREGEKMRGRDPSQHITAGNWFLPEAFSMRKIFEPVFSKTSQFPLLNVSNFRQKNQIWTLCKSK